MPGATLKDVAKLAGLAPVTVSRVVNGAENVKASTREKVLAIIRDVGYSPNVHAASLRRQGIGPADESARQHRPKAARTGLSSGSKSFLNLSEATASRSSSERRSLVQQLSQLRRDLNLLLRKAEHMRTRVDAIQQNCLDEVRRNASH